MTPPPRRTYELTQQQEDLLEHARTHPPILIPGQETRSRQQAVDAAWQRIADDQGFDWTTVKPLSEYDRRHFTAIPRI